MKQPHSLPGFKPRRFAKSESNKEWNEKSVAFVTICFNKIAIPFYGKTPNMKAFIETIHRKMGFIKSTMFFTIFGDIIVGRKKRK